MTKTKFVVNSAKIFTTLTLNAITDKFMFMDTMRLHAEIAATSVGETKTTTGKITKRAPTENFRETKI